jgi:hypothetical protein
LSVSSQCNTKLDFVLDAEGDGHVLYVTSSNGIALSNEQVGLDGGKTWVDEGLSLCSGAVLEGSVPSLALTTDNGYRIHYANLITPDAGITHYLYQLGP